MCFFGWVLEKRPQGGPKKRWKDIIRKDLNDLNIPESCWYDLANKSRSAWKDHYHACLKSSQLSYCNVDFKPLSALTDFRNISDLKRHKCIAERKNLHISKKEPLNARPVRSIFEAKEAMQYTNASICMGKF